MINGKGMTKKQEAALKDMAAFIMYSINNKMVFMWVLGNLGHDVSGFVNKERLFTPRSKGFAKSTGLKVVR